jgi:predicted metal-dependent enzyme (double-stranded beta helix superfamily)
MADPTLQQLIDEVETIVAAGGSEEEITAKVAGKLTGWLAEGPAIDPDYRRPDDDKYVLYPLHVDPEGRFSIASAVWNVGQSTPVHGHETWGVVGIYSGVEHEIAYAKPHSEGEKLVQVAESARRAGSARNGRAGRRSVLPTQGNSLVSQSRKCANIGSVVVAETKRGLQDGR